MCVVALICRDKNSNYNYYFQLQSCTLVGKFVVVDVK